MKLVTENKGPIPHADKVFLDTAERVGNVDPMVYAEQLHFTATTNLEALTLMDPHVLSGVITEEEAEQTMSHAREVLRIIRRANEQRRFDSRP
ncbi:hypothetical protein J8F10_24255 [Gemmata sp. G18]|uniref:Uncharacterized protein n=1 Tax=Gemmata palustris TaxID=2822762 RepID=A0ABS5BXA3_9BACT|nr:hypothetical protein [Gemmata palustris]MBP3958374.1 hypothetical protein [Gemmata palustris]